MEKKIKIIIAVLLAIDVIVILVFVFHSMTLGLEDYWATYEESPLIVRVSDNTIRFELTCASGYPDPTVKFSDCAIALLVNGEATSPMDLKLHNVHAPGGDANARSVKGIGTMNATVMTQGNVSYIVTFFDQDNDGLVGPGDYVTVQCTEPLSLGNSYTLNVYVDIDGTWGIGTIYGTYTA